MSEHELQYMVDAVAKKTLTVRKKYYSAGIISILISAGGIIFAIGVYEGNTQSSIKTLTTWKDKYEPVIDRHEVYIAAQQKIDNEKKMKYWKGLVGR